MKNITKEQIDKIFVASAENNLLDLNNQFMKAMEQIPEQSESPMAYAIVAASIAQGNIMAALKDIFYELLTDND